MAFDFRHRGELATPATQSPVDVDDREHAKHDDEDSDKHSQWATDDEAKSGDDNQEIGHYEIKEEDEGVHCSVCLDVENCDNVILESVNLKSPKASLFTKAVSGRVIKCPTEVNSAISIVTWCCSVSILCRIVEDDLAF